MNLDDIIDLAEAAKDLGIAPVTLRAAIGRGRFAARKFGNSWVTTRQEVARYRAENLGQVGRPPIASQLEARGMPVADELGRKDELGLPSPKRR